MPLAPRDSLGGDGPYRLPDPSCMSGPVALVPDPLNREELPCGVPSASLGPGSISGAQPYLMPGTELFA